MNFVFTYFSYTSTFIIPHTALQFLTRVADIWAAGICLYIFVTGKLPFYSTVPLDLFEMIAKAEVQYSDLGLSDELIDLLKCCLEKDPNCRAGVGDCLHHPFLKNAREQRIQELGAEFQTSRPVIDISEDDIRMAFRTVTSVPVQVLRTAGKKISEGLAHTRDNLRSRMHSMPSMGSSTNSKDEHPNRNCKNSGIDSKKDDNIVNIDSSSKKKCDHNVVYFNRQESGDSVHSNPFSVESDIHENDNGSVTDTPFSRLSSGISFGSNMTEEIPPTMEEDYDRGDDQGHYDDNQHNPDVFEADESRLPVHSASDTTIGRRNEHHLVGKQPERLQRTSTASISDGDSMKHENKKGAEHPGCLIH
ncbi:MAG: serine/threonine protein kinase [Bacillariaceae sp.]